MQLQSSPMKELYSREFTPEQEELLKTQAIAEIYLVVSRHSAQGGVSGIKLEQILHTELRRLQPKLEQMQQAGLIDRKLMSWQLPADIKWSNDADSEEEEDELANQFTEKELLEEIEEQRIFEEQNNKEVEEPIKIPPFSVGDRVYNSDCGWGVVKEISRDGLADKIIASVDWNESSHNNLIEVALLQSSDARDYDWLTGCSWGDINCQNALKRASIATLEKALEYAEAHPAGNKLRIRGLRQQLRRVKVAQTKPSPKPANDPLPMTQNEDELSLTWKEGDRCWHLGITEARIVKVEGERVEITFNPENPTSTSSISPEFLTHFQGQWFPKGARIITKNTRLTGTVAHYHFPSGGWWVKFDDGKEAALASDSIEADSDQAPELPAIDTTQTGEKWLDPRGIIIDAGTQSRTKTDIETRDRYAELMAEGLWEWERKPLPVVFCDGKGDIWAGDCHHRTSAAVLADVEWVLYDVRPGTKIDAILYSCSANAAHGLPLTPKDQRRRVELLLDTIETLSPEQSLAKIKEIPDLSAKELERAEGRFDSSIGLPDAERSLAVWSSYIIAKHLGLTQSQARTVQNILAEREMSAKISRSGLDVGDRVEVTQIAGAFAPGTTGLIDRVDPKKGILLASDQGTAVWVSPDALQPTTKISHSEPEDEDVTPEETPSEVKSASAELKGQQKNLIGRGWNGSQVLPDSDRPTAPAEVDDRPGAYSRTTIAVEIAQGIKHLTPDELKWVFESTELSPEHYTKLREALSHRLS
ncbi:hypothetical protein H6F70_05735 [Coleofasciculus sp. FACHB-T130]|nr:hypothetical protein [Coleofasciculus sp. FACHB-T130]